jgi:RHS repeat-associated protein
MENQKGEELTFEGSLKPVDQPYYFTGREWDSGAEVYYYRARYYDPNNGRFLSHDPIGLEAGDTNFYRYVNNNPIGLVDPMGLWTAGLGSSASISGFGMTASASFTLNFDGHGNINTATSAGAGASVGLPGFQVNVVEVNGSNAENINQLRGPGFQTGGNLVTPVGIGGSAGAFGGSGYAGGYGGIGFGTPGASFSTQVTATGLGGDGARSCPK